MTQEQNSTSQRLEYMEDGNRLITVLQKQEKGSSMKKILACEPRGDPSLKNQSKDSPGAGRISFKKEEVMKRVILLLVLSVGLLVAAACGGAAEPTPTPTPTATPIKEWNLEGIQVDGATVTVSLRVFAAIDVWATLDGKPSDEVRPIPPTIEYVFHNVTPGTHTVEVRDIVGHSETAEVVMPPPTATPTPPPLSTWLTDLIQKLENEPVANPPASISQYEYKGQTVYFLPQRCCDIPSTLYDADGNIIGHPDGGITGQGDGRVPDFFEERSNERIVWEDERDYDPGLVQVPAPIESVEILIMESFPPQYMLVVVSGLPNACVSFAGYYLDRDGDAIRVETINWTPADPEIACPAIYTTVETRIPLGSEFESGKIYTVVVNDVTETFVAQ